MKSIQYLFVLGILLFPYSRIFSQVYVGSPVSVTNNDDSFGKKSPKIGINGDGNPVVFWVRTGANEAFFVSIKNENGFSAPIEVPLNGVNPNIWSGSLGPNLAVHGSHLYIVFEKYGEAIYIVHSPDNGTTWDAPVPAFTPPDGRKATIPNLAVDNDGNLYVIYINTNNQESDAFYGIVKSTDQGSSFSQETVVNNLALGNEVCECCNGDISIDDNGDVYVTFRNNDNNLRDIWVARSTDGAVSFSSAFDIDQTDWILNACPSNGPRILVANGVVYTTFFSAASGWENDVYFSSLDVNSETITNTTAVPAITDIGGSHNSPSIAGAGDTLMIVFDNYYDFTKNISFVLSTSGIEGMTTSQVAFQGGDNQSKPQVVYRQGVFYLVYQDNDTDTVLYQEIGYGITNVAPQNLPTLSIFPNPSTGSFSLAGVTVGASIEIFNAIGERIFDGVAKNTKEIFQFPELNAGVYFIKTNSENTCQTLVWINQ